MLVYLYIELFSSYYDATIDRISDDGTTCTVTLEPFGNTEIIKVTVFTVCLCGCLAKLQKLQTKKP
jgi:hypothetical protein